ncbi:MAG: leucine-rich repeat domain-containing protein, partial [Spirochaetaceae bacterium]|nr:leucine-rich repeat domain-containing protein [Spirochaetaceae bacterium]
FSECNSISSVTLPSTIKTIRFGAFSPCDALATVTVPASVTAVEFGTEGVYGSAEGVFGTSIMQPSKLNLATQALLKKLGYKGRL